MKSTTILRWCLILEWVFILIGAAAAFVLESKLPAPLTAWLKADADRGLTSVQLAVFAAGISLLALSIIATVGLLCLRRWAAWLYLFTTALGIFLMPLTGPMVVHALADTFGEISSLMSGMVIALVFFTNSLNKDRDMIDAEQPVQGTLHKVSGPLNRDVQSS